MRNRWAVVLLAGSVLIRPGIVTAARKASGSPTDPIARSGFPFTGQIGATVLASVRGTNLAQATAVCVEGGAFAASVDPTPTQDSTKAAAEKTPADVVHLKIRVRADAGPGRYSFRLMTAKGVSNALSFYVVKDSVAAEPEGSHETPDTAVAVTKFPIVLSGQIAKRGETDFYAFEVAAGQTLTFQAISGLQVSGAPGANTAGFDPAISLYEPSGSWFDSKRINRIAFNDEPLWVVGKPTGAWLVRTFEKKGRYLLRIEAFSGQGGPDYGYQIKITPGDVPQDQEPIDATWQERDFRRHLSANRLNELEARAGKPENQKAIETYGMASSVKLPATVEGNLTRAGEAQRTRFHLDGPQDIAFEIETPADTLPVFNPIVRLLDAHDQEVATNIFATHDRCTNEMAKTIQAKTIVPLRDAGDYTIEVRDTTPDHASPGFRYRIQVRPQIAHVGLVAFSDDHVNLSPGQVKTVRVMFDREEGYVGSIAVMAESLPAGVQILSGADFEPDVDPPTFKSKHERYTPRTERAVVVFAAASNAAITAMPQIVQLVVRPVMDGKLGAVIGSKQLPITVLAAH